MSAKCVWGKRCRTSAISSKYVSCAIDRPGRIFWDVLGIVVDEEGAVDAGLVHLGHEQLGRVLVASCRHTPMVVLGCTRKLDWRG
jgi:hypothetical protein